MVEDMDPELFYADTSDGWKLGLRRYRPKTSKKISEYPVVVCHGFASNHRSVDYGEPGTEEWRRYSLAAYLSQGHGGEVAFDVWVPDLRGRDISQTYDPKENPERYDWCIDDYIEKDVPAILKRIQEQYQSEGKGKKRVIWIGKSMGGMIIYAYGQRSISRKTLKNVVIMGSPVRFTYTNTWTNMITRFAPRNMSGPIRTLEHLADNPALFELIKNNIAKNGQIDPEVIENHLKTGFANTLSMKEVEQFALFLRHKTFCRYPESPWLYDTFDWLSARQTIPALSGKFTPKSYTDDLWKFKHPLLVIAGGGDNLAHVEDVRYGYEHVGSIEKDFILFYEGATDEEGKVYSTYDYGHLDLNLGIRAHDEIFPKIYEWIVEHINTNI